MSVQSEIDRIAGAKSDIATAIASKGVTVPSGTKLDGMAALINSISGGGNGSIKNTVSATIDCRYTRAYYYDAYENIQVISNEKLTVDALHGMVIAIKPENIESESYELKSDYIYIDSPYGDSIAVLILKEGQGVIIYGAAGTEN